MSNESNKIILYNDNFILKSDDNIPHERAITIFKPKDTPIKELMVDITSENNPFILFVMKLSQADFDVLKATQGLTLDFFLFPDKLIYLLKQTKLENSRMYISFVEDKMTGFHLSIKEETTIKHITHLSLKFQHGSDLEIKGKVLTYISELQKNLYIKEKSCNELTDLISSLKKEIHKNEAELCAVKDTHSQHLHQLENNLVSQSEELERNKDQILKYKEEIEQLRADLLLKKEDSEKNSAIINTLQKENNVLRKDNDVLKTRLLESAAKIESSNSQFTTLQKNVNTLKIRLSLSLEDVKKKDVEIDSLKKCNEEMKNMVFKKQQVENTLQLHLDEALRKIRALSEKNVQTNTDLYNTNLELKELQEKNKSNDLDLKKANQIICRLQQETQSLKSFKFEVEKKLNECLDREEMFNAELNKKEVKINEQKKKLTKYQTESELKEKQIKNLTNDKINLQKTLSSVYKELAEIKLGSKASGNLFGNSENMDFYYYKKFLQESKGPDSVPFLQPDHSQNNQQTVEQESKTRQHEPVAESSSSPVQRTSDTNENSTNDPSPKENLIKEAKSVPTKEAAGTWLGLRRKTTSRNVHLKKT